MKKLTVLVMFLIVSTMALNAQMWMYNQFRVTNMNELNERQLNIIYDQGENYVSIGKTMTTIGGVGVVIGSIIYWTGLNNMMVRSSSKADTWMFGLGIATVGGTVMSIGIPLWFIGAQRKGVAEIHLAKFANNYVPSIGLVFSL